MSDIIRLLPDSVANQIAAGEVIQRPASVIKELIENAVDAGSTYIRVYIKDAGRTLIQVVDNGKGMSDTDARMAFERHATSKIIKAEDLFSLSTMGFRGEALPSVCAVSQVELKTKQKDASMGTKLLINASKVESQEPVVCDEGTNIMIKNLFFNVPARRKFLKSDSVELSNILREFERLALVNNNIRMSIDYGGKVIDLRPASFKQRIADIWKNSIEKQLLPIEIETSLIKISGFISRPEFAKRRNPLQYLIVNGRNMRHPYFHKAILGCYESLIATDTQPCYFIKFEVDPASIDVNIHPTKNEIKFEYEPQIWQILQASVKAALGHFGAVPSIDFSLESLQLRPMAKGEKPVMPKENLNPDYSPFETGAGSYNKGENSNLRAPKNEAQKNWESLYYDFMKSARGFGEQKEEQSKKNSSFFPEIDSETVASPICLQHNLRYILTSSGPNLLIIDQRRAHVKILFEDFLNNIRNGEPVSQRIMFPEFLELDNSQLAVFNSVIDELEKIGFKIEMDDDGKGKIFAVPAIISGTDYGDLVLAIIENLMEDDVNFGRNQDVEAWIDKKIALAMARKSAIPVSGKLSNDEMEHIVSRLFSLPDPSISPDGNVIYVSIDNNRIENYFS